MSTLQITMLVIWAGLFLGFIYSVGEQFGSGWDAVLGLLGVVATYAAAGALLYFTAKAIFGF